MKDKELEKILELADKGDKLAILKLIKYLLAIRKETEKDIKEFMEGVKTILQDLEGKKRTTTTPKGPYIS